MQDLSLGHDEQVDESDFMSNLDEDFDAGSISSFSQNSKPKNSLGKDKSERSIDILNEFPEEREFRVENTREITEGDRKQPLKFRNMKIKGLGLKPPVLSASGLPSVDVTSLNLLAGDPPNGKFGKAYDHFK